MDYSIGDLVFRLFTSIPLDTLENLTPFLEKAEKCDFLIHLSAAKELPDLPGEVIWQNDTLTVYEKNGNFTKKFKDFAGGKATFISSYSKQNDVVHATVLIEEKYGNLLNSNWLARCCFEEMLLSKERLILHASLISTQFGGVAFSGPSGIGKSTQAALWIENEGSVLINGDRPILGKQAGTWTGYGSPYAGSSQCYKNERVPIAAIVLLEQGEDCVLRPATQLEAFRGLYAGVVVNSWNPEFVSKVADMILDMIQSVPVYHFCCTPTLQAVSVLKAELIKGDVAYGFAGDPLCIASDESSNE